jgi:hypothetical protein
VAFHPGSVAVARHALPEREPRIVGGAPHRVAPAAVVGCDGFPAGDLEGVGDEPRVIRQSWRGSGDQGNQGVASTEDAEEPDLLLR